MCASCSSHVQLFAAPWIGAHQAALPMGFFRQEYWHGLPFSSIYYMQNFHDIIYKTKGK